MENKKQIQQEKLAEIKKLSMEFQETMKGKLCDLCDILPYKEGSILSYSIDRLESYTRQLNEFKLKD